MIPKAVFEMLLPPACSWAEKQETIILQDGVALTAPLLADEQLDRHPPFRARQIESRR